MIQEKVEPAPIQRSLERALRLSAFALLALLAAYLFLPVLTPTHVEGFTASVASLALHLRLDALSNFDPVDPLNVEYFGMTKLGWMLIVSTFTTLGLNTTLAMTLLNWTAALAFFAGTIFLIRKWTAAPYWSIVLGLILLPGASESTFFFNDNLIASSLFVGSLCALFLDRRWVGAGLCGLLFGVAVLTRTDTVLVGAAIPIVLWERDGFSRRWVLTLAIIGLTSALVVLGSLAAFNATIFDLFEVAGAAMQAWNRPTIAGGPLALVYFLGIPGAALALAGGFALVARRDWILCMRLTPVPILFLILMWGRLWEVRQILPLTPFFAGLAALALRDLLQVPRDLRSTIVQGVFAGIVTMTLFGPRLFENQSDGPRVLTGRLENIAQWQSWQNDIRRDFALLSPLVDAPRHRARVIIVDFWNEDRFTHLALEEAGYRISRAQGSPCRTIAEEALKGADRIVVVRLSAGYVPYWRAVSGQRLERMGIPCIDSLRTDDVVLLANQKRLDTLFPTSWPKVRTIGGGNMRALFIGRGDIGALVNAYRGEIARVDPSVRIGTLEEASSATRRRTGFGT